MTIHTFRANSMQEAIQQVRTALGPDAAVLQARPIRRGLSQLLTGSRQVEVVASADVPVPSRLPSTKPETDDSANAPSAIAVTATSENATPYPRYRVPPAHEQDFRSAMRNNLKAQRGELRSLVEELSACGEQSASRDLPEGLFQLFTDLIDAEVSEDLTRELIDRVRQGATTRDLEDSVLLKARVARLIEDEFRVSGPIQVSAGCPRLVALVGPTGVGKTTTVAKLAANFRLRERRRVGLITVDTYRIAAVEQLRTYADIIDLPMEVVSTPREMRQAVDRLSGLDVLLLDTAGRSPRDDVRIQELKSMLAEAAPHEVHLVLSSVASESTLCRTAEKFSAVGATSLLMTKLDEATGLGNLLPLVRNCRLPLSYVTTGQNVPDDIEPAESRKLTRVVLGANLQTKTYC